MDFTQAAITAGFRGRRVLSVLLLPLAVGLFRPEGVPDAWVYLWTGNLLNLWWLGALWLLPPAPSGGIGSRALCVTPPRFSRALPPPRSYAVPR